MKTSNLEKAQNLKNSKAQKLESSKAPKTQNSKIQNLEKSRPRKNENLKTSKNRKPRKTDFCVFWTFTYTAGAAVAEYVQVDVHLLFDAIAR